MTQVPVEVLSEDEVARLLADPDQSDVFGLRDAAILSCLYYAAATAGEVAHLDVRDHDARRGNLRLHPDEGKPRRVPMEAELADILGRYLDEARLLLLAQAGAVTGDETPAMFLTNKGHRIHVQDVRQMLGGHSKAVGITTAVNYNTLRLSRAWHLREAGASPESIQRLLGASGRSGRRVI